MSGITDTLRDETLLPDDIINIITSMAKPIKFEVGTSFTNCNNTIVKVIQVYNSEVPQFNYVCMTYKGDRVKTMTKQNIKVDADGDEYVGRNEKNKLSASRFY